MGQVITLNDRVKLEATGVHQVVSFDSSEITLETELGLLVLKGEGMHINQLDLESGVIVIEGLIASVEYSEHRTKKIKAKGKNILERILK